MKSKRRVVTEIHEYLDPAKLFKLIHRKEWPYAPSRRNKLGCRDRAVMATCFASAGRISEVVGGPQIVNDEVVGRHKGLECSHLKFTKDHIIISSMPVVKRSLKVLKKHGGHAAFRDEFALPLKPDLYSNRYWDQLIPFAWLLYEYLAIYNPKRGKIFDIEATRAYQIIRHVTGKWPHWFRAQAEHFYGHWLLADTIKLAKFVKVQDPKQVKHYIGYSWKDQLKDREAVMDFSWISKAVEEIKKRMPN